MNYSLTIGSGGIAVVLFFLNWLGLPFTEAELSTTFYVVVTIFSFIGVYIGRVRHGDVTWWGAKIPQE